MLPGTGAGTGPAGTGLVGTQREAFPGPHGASPALLPLAQRLKQIKAISDHMLKVLGLRAVPVSSAPQAGWGLVPGSRANLFHILAFREGWLFPGYFRGLQKSVEMLKQADCAVSHRVTAARRGAVRLANKTWEKPESTQTLMFISIGSAGL